MRELNLAEMDQVAGGIEASTIAAGAGLIGLGLVIAGTGGLAAIPIGLMGAATAGEMMLAGAAISAAGGGGWLIGTGLRQK
ncbi:MAG: hypothetical protein EOR25_29945 [Mesorhizobium sp.]|uniref:hypothetical protein n=1 Tax=Mesorhizobium sp. TaxID=1871066 RepID=UPI000FE2AB72|nr:hypothetical protein [Mesorhizobium sp.]RWJ04872.1 MAG: hypothetical protein EOR24_29845 [Mesorhizobium sp.]RWJ11927.1 MAG: hypothetical protein EOR25_29945 [Mesorhizobium sp.]